ncbi:cytochrome-c peroxidase [Pseudopedobacter beijingensis]|uniref:Cytochrome-c peroxidase n=1 Tax=Pseudopedobacter beijingensis TaxID=1207056 RepID=A0ABW4IFM9_9SPHI
MKKKYWTVLATILLFVIACSKKDDIEQKIEETFPGFKIPGNFPKVVYKLENNPITEDGFRLGKALFNEGQLSRDGTISCASCHIQASAFTHHGHDVSHGIEDRLGTRNSPPIMNLAWRKSFMWDGGILDLDFQPFAPITAHEEMDEDVNHVLQKLRNTSKYPVLFKSAFGSEEINSARMMKALSQFMLMCISANAKYDKVMRGEEGTAFTEIEQRGYLLFKQKCAACHSEPLFTDESLRNNGIGVNVYGDEGRFKVTENPDDLYRFKVPSLRNLKYTPPYMHDGSFYTLKAVLDHYSRNVEDMPTLDPLLKQNGKLGIALSEQEKLDLLAFLETLNDESFIRSKLLSL